MSDQADDTVVETPAVEVPLVEAPEKPLYIGQFTPGFGFSLESLVELIQGFGLLNTPVFTGRDQQGNLLNDEGQVVMPAHLARHFTPAQVQRTNAA